MIDTLHLALLLTIRVHCPSIPPTSTTYPLVPIHLYSWVHGCISPIVQSRGWVVDGTQGIMDDQGTDKKTGLGPITDCGLGKSLLISRPHFHISKIGIGWMFGKAPFFPHQGRNGIWTYCHIPHTQHKASFSRYSLNVCRVNE